MPKRRRKTVPPKKSAKVAPITTQALVQAAKSALAVPPSSGPDAGLSSPRQSTCETFRRLPPDSIVRTKAMHIIAMRMAGQTNAEIAKALDIAERSIKQYVYLAGRNGWLVESENWADPADRLEYELSHKVIRNLDRALDDEATRPIGKDSVTLEVAKGTLFKKFGEVAGMTQMPNNVLAVKIEVIGGKVPENEPVIESGAARFVEAEIVQAVE